jgi:hypothetical protein
VTVHRLADHIFAHRNAGYAKGDLDLFKSFGPLGLGFGRVVAAVRDGQVDIVGERGKQPLIALRDRLAKSASAL